MFDMIKRMFRNISQKTLIIIIVAILLISLGGYFYWSSSKKTKITGEDALEGVNKGADIITDSATKGVLPSIETNPLNNKPDLNPADKANPFKDIKVNPFE